MPMLDASDVRVRHLETFFSVADMIYMYIALLFIKKYTDETVNGKTDKRQNCEVVETETERNGNYRFAHQNGTGLYCTCTYFLQRCTRIHCTCIQLKCMCV